MMGFRVMFTKELVELWRTRRALVLGLAALFVGYGSPMTWLGLSPSTLKKAGRFIGFAR